MKDFSFEYDDIGFEEKGKDAMQNTAAQLLKLQRIRRVRREDLDSDEMGDDFNGTEACQGIPSVPRLHGKHDTAQEAKKFYSDAEWEALPGEPVLMQYKCPRWGSNP